MTLFEILTILLIHWFADFVMQDEKWALGKSKNWDDLLRHTATYSCVWFVPILFIILTSGSYTLTKIGWGGYIGFFIPVTFIFHTITDYFTSRIVSKKFAKKEYGTSIPNTGAFTIIGIDQWLHYLQLFTTYYYLKQL